MPHPEIRFVVWGGQDPAQLESDWQTLFANGVFDRLAEYQIVGGSLGPTIQALPDLQPDVFDDAWIWKQFSHQVAFGPGIAWVIVLPPGSSTPILQANSWNAYHFWSSVPYAVAPYNEVLISHEIYEMATDPIGLGYIWGGKEVGDFCEGQSDSIAGVNVQKVWSAAAGACL